MDDIIWKQSVYSDGTKNFISNTFPKKGDSVTFAIQMISENPAPQIFFMALLDGQDVSQKMQFTSSNNGLDRYEASINVYEKDFSYYFYIVRNGLPYCYGSIGLSTYFIDKRQCFRLLIDYSCPKWVQNAVFYHIFPDRFCNGDPSLDVQDNEYEFEGHPTKRITDWKTPPANFYEAFCLDFYNGDIPGIIQKIPYFKKMGVTALYLNPIFAATTTHRYNTFDYSCVDKHLGGNEALARLSELLHKEDIKLMLDVSIDHTGLESKWFNRDGTFFPKTVGAYNNPESTERCFYYFDDDNMGVTANRYKCWSNIPTLPTLNYSSQCLRDKIYRDKDSVIRKWLQPPYSIDAWRFDVASIVARNNQIQLHHQIWPAIRKAVHEENPNTYILGETWWDGSDFLNGDEWDAPMNYHGSCIPIRAFYGVHDFKIRDNITKYLTNKQSAEDITTWIMGYLMSLPVQIQSQMFNFIDSHSISRFHNHKGITRSMVHGANIIAFTLPGCVSIYYGDEISIDGGVDELEECRYPMDWSRDIEHEDMYKFYSTLCHIKTSNEEFCSGGVQDTLGQGWHFCVCKVHAIKNFFDDCI